MKYVISLLVLLAMALPGLRAQTLFAPGDIAFLGIQSGQAGVTATDRFAFVLLKPAEEGTRLLFTDNAVLNSGPPVRLCRNENFCRWTATAPLPAGTVITYTEDSVVSVGTGLGGLSLSQSGDQILALQVQGNDTIALAGISTTGWAATCAAACGGTANNETCLPAGLTAGQQAVGFAAEQNNAYFLAPSLSGSISELLAAINDPNNWSQSGSLQTWPEWSFTITSAKPASGGCSVRIQPCEGGLELAQVPAGGAVLEMFSPDGRKMAGPLQVEGASARIPLITSTRMVLVRLQTACRNQIFRVPLR